MRIGDELDAKVEALLEEHFPGALVGLRTPRRFSRDLGAALRAFSTLAEVVGSWKGCDGYAHLCFAESAGHQVSEGCTLGPDVDEDPRPWSAHFHLGLIGADNPQMPSVWNHEDAHGATFCARGETLKHAIALAVVRALSG